MTRVCRYCHSVYGERCPICRGIAEVLSTGRFAKCPKRHGTFGVGEGGRTYGACDSCIARRHSDTNPLNQQKGA